MMSLDTTLFRWVNLDWANPALDLILPFFNGTTASRILVSVLALWLLIKGGRRGRMCVVLTVLSVLLTDSLITNPLKETFERPRPFLAMGDTRMLTGKGGSGSMPSGHAANAWTAAAVITAYYPATWPVAAPAAALVCLARVYSGVHYPSDVLVGMVIGLLMGRVWLRVFDKLWRASALKLIPPLSARFPSLSPGRLVAAEGASTVPSPDACMTEAHWLRLGWLVIALFFIIRMGYLAAGRIELVEDEAYQWMWSKHLALSYFSKPPLIAYAQYAGTRIGGDTAFGVRLLSPILAALVSSMLLRFVARESGARSAFFLVLISSIIPIVAVGATLMTIDALSVSAWTAAMVAGWAAVKKDSTAMWVLTGFFLALGFLAKYTGAFQLVSFALWFWLEAKARAQLKRPGPWLALLINLLALLPVYLWNSHHGWITLTHLQDRAGLQEAWRFNPGLATDFALQEFLLLHPVFFVATLVAVWRILRGGERTPVQLYALVMGLPLFVGYALYTVRARVQPNWIAPSILPLLLVSVLYWEKRWTAGERWWRRWMVGGIAFGILAVTLLHESRLVGKLSGISLEPKYDWLTRARGWSAAAKVVSDARDELKKEGKEVFVVAHHYGFTSLLSFYWPEAKSGVPDHRMVFYPFTEKPDNQYYFWASYTNRVGQNALFVHPVDKGSGIPAFLTAQFESVNDLGAKDVVVNGKFVRQVQIYACRELKPKERWTK